MNFRKKDLAKIEQINDNSVTLDIEGHSFL